ncbi:MAG: F0F1 ATP synthase subunit gamma [Gammaproteobacteria bacterium]|nr:F0F1 ATP synthase subunit gamma [Gammaproteobacteria bacterium]
MSGKEIRGKIGTIKNTQKITKAMQLVAASKVKKAQDHMEASLPYADNIRRVIGHVAASHSEYHHPFLQTHSEIKKVGYIVVSSDRGLCGGLNANLFKSLLKGGIHDWQSHGVDVDLCLIGSKAELFFRHSGFNLTAHTEHLGDVPEIANLIGTVKVMLDAYKQGELDSLYISYNKYINTMTQRPTTLQLLPLTVPEKQESKRKYWDYIYEPDAKKLLDHLLRRYIEAQVYQAVIDNIACEQAARMVAMKSATDNAAELINDLELAYNKSRQAAITKEISEIIGGAEAV